MQTPHQLTLEEFSHARMEWIHAKTHEDGEFVICNKCQGKIELRGAFISIHDWRFGNHCCGSGRVIRLAIPFCPRCEPEPQESGCIHEIEPHWDGHVYLWARPVA